MEVARLSELEPFVTKDGSTIRELAGPAWTAVRNQSLAEASVAPGGETDEHYHVNAEELYYFVGGAGRMRLGEDEQDVAAGDCVVIPPGGETDEHYHVQAEELYYFVAGAGRMRLGEEEQDVAAGDCVVIPPGARHKLWSGEAEPLKLLCCCSPAYRHEDTVLTED